MKPLTKTETKLLTLLGTGMSNKEMAKHLDISIRTIETHRAHLVQKTGMVGSRLVIYAYQVTQEHIHGNL